jgi:hypothetical protein
MKQFRSNPFYKFIIFPIGQMLLFILGAGLTLSIFIILMAYIFRGSDPIKMGTSAFVM